MLQLAMAIDYLDCMRKWHFWLIIDQTACDTIDGYRIEWSFDPASIRYPSEKKTQQKMRCPIATRISLIRQSTYTVWKGSFSKSTCENIFSTILHNKVKTVAIRASKTKIMSGSLSNGHHEWTPLAIHSEATHMWLPLLRCPLNMDAHIPTQIDRAQCTYLLITCDARNKSAKRELK